MNYISIMKVFIGLVDHSRGIIQDYRYYITSREKQSNALLPNIVCFQLVEQG